ncbi:thioredoxin [Perkinsela sp. CCAP 1560/4]|nr:thioredoxin [Perkinsela sp. CCAP 1560/4]KNH06597.1 thioredoxin [Perkinsela sp. CCAP 1560/4]|eukprot:KNH04156.1 thioredoxin [Perkinsela sp. CCAP 1560/4]
MTNEDQPDRKRGRDEAPTDGQDTQNLVYGNGYVSTEKTIIAIKNQEELLNAIQNSEKFFQERFVETFSREISELETHFYVLLCLNAPWTNQSPTNYPVLKEVQQKLHDDGASKHLRVFRATVDCSLIENAVGLCEVSTRLPCVQLWCGGVKCMERAWDKSLLAKTQTDADEPQQFSLPFPLHLPFELPLLTNESSANKIRIIKRLHENTGESVQTPSDASYAVLVISSAWCAPCTKLKSVLPKLATDYATDATFFLCDYDAYPEVREFYGVKKIPTVVVVSATSGVAHGSFQHSDETKVRNFLDQTMKIFRLDDDF